MATTSLMFEAAAVSVILEAVGFVVVAASEPQLCD